MSFNTSETITVLPEQETYKHPDAVILPLDAQKLTLSLAQAKNIFMQVKDTKYSAELIMKTIILVQCVQEPIYNLTGLTRSLKTLNVQIAMDGRVLEESLQGLMQS